MGEYEKVAVQLLRDYVEMVDPSECSDPNISGLQMSARWLLRDIELGLPAGTYEGPVNHALMCGHDILTWFVDTPMMTDDPAPSKPVPETRSANTGFSD